MSRKLSLEDAITLAYSRGGKCLSEKYINSGVKMKWECKFGHVWETKLGHIKQGSWCPYCAGKHTLKSVCHLAAERKGRCLSNKYVNDITKMTFMCEFGHVWEAKLKNIIQGHWCTVCAGNLKLSIKDAHIIAELNNGTCLSEKYINAQTKMKWRCKFGHEWESTHNNIKSGHWCPYCAGVAKKKIKDCYNLARKNKGLFISKSYINSGTRYLWRCKNGHEFYSTYDDVNSGRWCSRCTTSAPQKKLAHILENTLNQKCEFNYRPDWMKNPETGYNLEIDIYFPKLKLAIEYNGKQHYHPIDFSGKLNEKELMQQFKEQQKRDRIKEKIIKSSDMVSNFVVFSYKEDISKSYIVSKLKNENGIL